jgi:hypothetical protein
MAIKFEHEEKKPKRKTFAKIEAVFIARGEVEPAKVHKPKAGRPRIGSEQETLKAKKPWLECRPPLSRSTWYRRLKEGEAK